MRNEILNLGNDLINCQRNCQGVSINRPNGIIPKCLYLIENGLNQSGCVIVGINPGSSNNNERDFYMEFFNNNHLDYNHVKEFWVNNIYQKHQYYTRLKKFISLAGFNGSVLWTELAKCENDVDGEIKSPTLQTFRTCIFNFLLKEIALVPKDWLLIAVGRQAHNTLSFLYPTRSVLGVPHPTSSRGYFSSLFTNDSITQFIEPVREQLNIFSMNNGISMWLSA